MFNPVPFLTYILLMAFTPGPNNIMSMSNASEKGLRKSFPFNLGILLGFLAVMAFCTFFSSALYSSADEAVHDRGRGGVHAEARVEHAEAAEGKQGGRGVRQGFLAGALLQFVNPKLYIYGVTAMSSYILPHFSGYAALLGFVFLLAFVGFTATICWAIFGVGLSRLFKDHSRLMNGMMAALLCYCAVSLFF